MFKKIKEWLFGKPAVSKTEDQAAQAPYKVEASESVVASVADQVVAFPVERPAETPAPVVETPKEDLDIPKPVAKKAPAKPRVAAKPKVAAKPNADKETAARPKAAAKTPSKPRVATRPKAEAKPKAAPRKKKTTE